MDINNVYIRDSLLYGELIEIGVTGPRGSSLSTHYTTLTYNEAEALINKLQALMSKMVENQLEAQYGR